MMNTAPRAIVKTFVESDKQTLRLPKGIIGQSYRVAVERYPGIKLAKDASIGGQYYLIKEER